MPVGEEPIAVAHTTSLGVAVTLILDPWDWLDSEGALPEHEPQRRERALLIARLIEAGALLNPGTARETLVECLRQVPERCMSLLWVEKVEDDTIRGYCLDCDDDEIVIHNWPTTPWAKGPMDAVYVFHMGGRDDS